MRWKRATILDDLLWDVFSHYWKVHRPAYATLFLNSTAHFQHMYWRNMDAASFAIKPSQEEQAEYERAVEAGYTSMDALVGECIKLAGPDTVIVLVSGLSQQPCLTYEDQSGKTFYRATDPDAFFAWAGVRAPYRYVPMMSEEFHLHFPDESTAAECLRMFEALTAHGKRIMNARQAGNEIHASCSVFTSMDGNTVVLNANGGQIPFGQLFYQADGLKSGMHHPDGIFWVRDSARKPSLSARRVSLRAVAPTIVAHFGIPKPDYMALDSVL